MQTQANKVEVQPITVTLPPYSELLQLHDYISNQLKHWRVVLANASANVDGLEDRKKAAEEFLKEPTATLRDKNDAQEELDRVSWRLTQQQKRLRAAEAMIQDLERRNKEFPHKEFDKLEAAQKKRDRLRDQIRGKR